MGRDPLQRLARRCNEQAWELLNALRSYPQFLLLVEALNTTQGALNEQAIAEAILDIEYPTAHQKQPRIAKSRVVC